MRGEPVKETADKQILAWCEESKLVFMENLKTLVNMDSGSDDYPELNAKAAVLKTMLEKAGANVRLEEAAAPREGTFNVVGVWQGTGKARIMYMAHYDTVWPKGEAAKRPFTVKGNRATGPGVNDRQNSVAGFPVFIDILLNKMGCRDFDTLTVIFNADEEKGSFGSRDLIMRLAAEHDVVYSLDGSCPDGDHVNTSARGTAYYDLYFKGVESHSGSAPEKGRNAGYEMAYQIMNMRDLSNKERGTDVNWTMGSFGTKSNIIPGVAHAHANARISYKDEWDRIENDIRERIKNKLFPESEITFKITRGRPPFEPNEATNKLAAKMVALSENELGWPLVGVQTGGANDSSYSSQTAPVAIDGFSLGGCNAHSLDEYYNLDHYVPRMYLWLRVAQETMRGNMVPLAGK